MFGIAITAISCLRASTDVHIAWLVESAGLPAGDPTDAIALTPGGGRLGTLANGALDAFLADRPATRSGVLLDIEFSVTDALIAGVEQGARAKVAVVHGAALPESIWEQLLQRRPVRLAARVDGNQLSEFSLLDPAAEPSGSHDQLVSSFVPVPRIAVFGAGPIADAIDTAAQFIGWQVTRAADPDRGVGLMNGLSHIDSAIVMGHDVEAAGRVLEAALASDVGYVGSIGSMKMQDQRTQWLAYRGVTDVSRMHGPAGIDIGASSPPEIALSVVAEALAVHRGANEP